MLSNATSIYDQMASKVLFRFYYFPKRTSGAPLHSLSKLYDVPVGFVSPTFFETVYCRICRRRRVAVSRYRINFLVLSSRVYSKRFC